MQKECHFIVMAVTNDNHPRHPELILLVNPQTMKICCCQHIKGKGGVKRYHSTVKNNNNKCAKPSYLAKMHRIEDHHDWMTISNLCSPNRSMKNRNKSHHCCWSYQQSQNVFPLDVSQLHREDANRKSTIASLHTKNMIVAAMHAAALKKTHSRCNDGAAHDFLPPLNSVYQNLDKTTPYTWRGGCGRLISFTRLFMYIYIWHLL